MNYKVRLYDIRGHLIQPSQNRPQIQIKTFPSGIYLMEIENLESGQRVAGKLVIRR